MEALCLVPLSGAAEIYTRASRFPLRLTAFFALRRH
jgi:hypothetical protein